METLHQSETEELLLAEIANLKEELHAELNNEKGKIVLQQLRDSLPRINSEQGQVKLNEIFTSAHALGLTSTKELLHAFHSGTEMPESTKAVQQLLQNVTDVLEQESSYAFYERFDVSEEAQCQIEDMSDAEQFKYSTQAKAFELLTELIERPEVDIENRGATFLSALSGGANGWFAVRKSYESGAIANARETLQRGETLTDEQELHLNEMGELTLDLMQQSETRKVAAKELIKMAVPGAHIDQEGLNWNSVKQEIWKLGSIYSAAGGFLKGLGTIGTVSHWGIEGAVGIRFLNKLRMGKKAADLANKYSRTFNNGVMAYAALAKVQQEQQIPLDSPPCFDGTFDDFALFLELHEQAV